jgi:hypothetical protein
VNSVITIRRIHSSSILNVDGVIVVVVQWHSIGEIILIVALWFGNKIFPKIKSTFLTPY